MSKTLVFSDGETLELSEAEQQPYGIFAFSHNTVKVSVTSQGWQLVQRALVELDSMDPASAEWQNTLRAAYCLGHTELVRRMVAEVTPKLNPDPELSEKKKVAFVRSKLEALHE